MGIIQCSNCGSVLPDQSRFCGRCGQLVPVFAEKDLDAPTIASSSGDSFVTFMSEDNLKTVRVQPISPLQAARTQESGPHTPIEYGNFDVDQFLATEAVGRLPTAPLPSVGKEQKDKEDEEKGKLYPFVGMAGGIAGLNALPNQMQVPMAQTPSLGSTPYAQGTPDLGGAIGGPFAPRVEGAMPQSAPYIQGTPDLGGAMAPRVEGAMPYQGFSAPPQTQGGAPALRHMQDAHQLPQQSYPQQSHPQQSYSQRYKTQSRQQQHQSIYGETSQGLNFLKGLLPVGGSLILIIIIIVSIMTLIPTFASGPRLIVTGGKAAPGAVISVRGEKFIPRGIVSFSVNGVPVASNGAMRLQVAVAGLSAPLLSDGEPVDNVHLANLSTVVGSDGTFVADIPLPTQLPANGRYIIEALEQSGQQTAKARLEVTVEQVPTSTPTATPTPIPTEEPTVVPTKEPTVVPTATATPIPTKEPTVAPTATPIPTKEPTVAPTPPPCVNVDLAELIFSQQEGNTGPQSQKFTITNCGQTGVVTLSKDASWLNLSTASLTLNGGAKGEIIVTASGNGLPVGSHTAQITVKSGTATKTVKVTLTITAVVKCSLIVDKGPLTYTMDQGGTNPGAKSIQVAGQNCTGGEQASVTVKTDTGGNWLRVDTTSVSLDAGNQSVLVSIDGGGRNAGKYTGRVIVAQGATTRIVEVVLTVASVAPKECLNVTPDTVKLEAKSGQEEPVGVDLTIENCGSSTALVKEAVTQGADWLSTDSTSVEIAAKSTGRVIIRASALKLAPGTYTGEAQFTVGTITRIVKVTFVVAKPPDIVCSLNISKDALGFTMEAEAPDPTPQSVMVSGTNCGQATVSIIAQDPTWLSAAPETIAVTPEGTTLTVSVDGQGFFDPVQLTGQVKVKVGAVERTIQVTLNITVPAPPPPPPCTVEVDQASLLFWMDFGQSTNTENPSISVGELPLVDPPAQAITVTSTGCGEGATILVEVGTNDGGNWLKAGLDGKVYVSVSSVGLEKNATYTGWVKITVGSASKTVQVTFNTSPGSAG